jgi:hypothetical protein
MHWRAERQIALMIADNGRGLPADIETQANGLGMQVLDACQATRRHAENFQLQGYGGRSFRGEIENWHCQISEASSRVAAEFLTALPKSQSWRRNLPRKSM